jgi:hypothetical protein
VIVAVVILSVFLAVSLAMNAGYVKMCDRWRKLYREARIREERATKMVNELLAEVEKRAGCRPDREDFN